MFCLAPIVDPNFVCYRGRCCDRQSRRKYNQGYFIANLDVTLDGLCKLGIYSPCNQNIPGYRQGRPNCPPRAQLRALREWAITLGVQLCWRSFKNENVKATPSGSNAGQGDCKTVACPKDAHQCTDGYRFWQKTHVSFPF